MQWELHVCWQAFTSRSHERKAVSTIHCIVPHCVGFLLAGILLGIRLSYFPLLAPALLMRLKHPERLKYIMAGTIGVLVWLIPLLWITGWKALITAAQAQSHGHFLDFGGTVSTHPELWLRLTKIFESIWADGFGLYWRDRHLITACTAILIGIIVIFNWKPILEAMDYRKTIRGQFHIFKPYFHRLYHLSRMDILRAERHP